MASASAIPAGRARSARCGTTSARCPTATDTATARTASATVYAATRGSIARRLTVRIRLAPATVSAPRARAFVKRVGKVPTAVKWTRKHCSAYRTAAVTEISISRPRPASASPCGPEMIARKVKGEN